MDMETLNELPQGSFIDSLKDIWPDGAWVAEAVEPVRPFQSIRGLHQAMAEVVKNASARQKMDLLEAFHTPQVEQFVQSRLDALEGESEETEAQRAAYDAYESQFGFPYFAILDVNEPLSVPDELTRRLENDAEEERMFALRYVSEQARERLENLLT